MALRKPFSLSASCFAIMGALIGFAIQASSAWSAQADQTLNVKSSASIGEQGIFYGQVSLSSWQQTYPWTASGQEVDLISAPIGFCPGAGYRKSFAPAWSWDVNGCVFLGAADLSMSSNDSASTLTYTTTKNNFVLGLQSQAGILWNANGGRHQFGIGVPLMFNHESFDAPLTGNISSSTQVQTGVFLESRFYSSGNFCVDPKLAWFQTSHNLLWSLNFGLDL